MASYEVRFRRTAMRELSWLDARDLRGVMDALLLLSADPRPKDAVPLAGGQRFRLTAAGHRVTYTIAEAAPVIVVAGVACGRAAYRGNEDPAAYFL